MNCLKKIYHVIPVSLNGYIIFREVITIVLALKVWSCCEKVGDGNNQSVGYTNVQRSIGIDIYERTITFIYKPFLRKYNEIIYSGFPKSAC